MTMQVDSPSHADAITATLSRLVGVLAEDAIFALASGHAPKASLEGLAKRRAEAYAAVLRQESVTRMTTQFDAWLVELVRAMAPIGAPSWVPMGEVIEQKVTLEVGARGLRSLFSSKPSEKDVQRVKRLGTLAVRVLRAVLAADGNIDAEEARTLAAVIGSLGLPQADAAPLYTEETFAVETMDMYGEVEPSITRALVRGAWLAAAWDAIDPREESVIRVLGQKLAVDEGELEAARAEAIGRVDVLRLAGLATVDAVRFVLSDRVPGTGVKMAADAGTLMLPRRFREEALAQVGHGAPVTLAKRFLGLAPEQRGTVLAIAWAAALQDDPSMGRQALLRARHERIAEDLEERGDKARGLVSAWLEETLAQASKEMR
jgi:hypothetical protein